jgi:hypothetical protein
MKIDEFKQRWSQLELPKLIRLVLEKRKEFLQVKLKPEKHNNIRGKLR